MEHKSSWDRAVNGKDDYHVLQATTVGYSAVSFPPKDPSQPRMPSQTASAPQPIVLVADSLPKGVVGEQQSAHWLGASGKEPFTGPSVGHSGQATEAGSVLPALGRLSAAPLCQQRRTEGWEARRVDVC